MFPHPHIRTSEICTSALFIEYLLKQISCSCCRILPDLLFFEPNSGKHSGKCPGSNVSRQIGLYFICRKSVVRREYFIPVCSSIYFLQGSIEALQQLSQLLFDSRWERITFFLPPIMNPCWPINRSLFIWRSTPIAKFKLCVVMLEPHPTSKVRPWPRARFIRIWCRLRCQYLCNGIRL